MMLGLSEKGRIGVYGLGSLWRIVWCMVIGVIGAVKVIEVYYKVVGILQKLIIIQVRTDKIDL